MHFKFESASLTLHSGIQLSNIDISNSYIGSLLIAEAIFKSIEIQSSSIGLIVVCVWLSMFDSLNIHGDNAKFGYVGSFMFLNGDFSKGKSQHKPSLILDKINVNSLVFDSIYNNGNIFISNVIASDVSHEFGYFKIRDTVISHFNHHKVDVSKYLNVFDDNSLDKISFKKYTCYIDSFVINSSDIGRINFVSCDFSYMNLYFRASKITEIFLSGTEMPKVAIGSQRDQQVAYAQLKKVYKSRGDSVLSNEYLGYELNAHYNAEKEKFTWNRFFKGDHWDIVTLGLNKHSNDFGSSWSQALGWIFKLMIPIYIAHNFALGYTIDGSKESWDAFWKLFSLFPEFVFPIHKADYISEQMGPSVTNWSRFWDVVGRIVSGYLIYQMVQAFRKFGKK